MHRLFLIIATESAQTKSVKLDGKCNLRALFEIRLSLLGAVHKISTQKGGTCFFKREKLVTISYDKGTGIFFGGGVQAP